MRIVLPQAEISSENSLTLPLKSLGKKFPLPVKRATSSTLIMSPPLLTLGHHISCLGFPILTGREYFYIVNDLCRSKYARGHTQKISGPRGWGSEGQKHASIYIARRGNILGKSRHRGEGSAWRANICGRLLCMASQEKMRDEFAR